MKMQLIVHSKAEERAFYAALREHREAQDLMQHAEQEHKRVEQVLEEMSDLDPRDSNFSPRLEELRGLVDDHVEEEETEILQRLQNELGKESGVQAERRSGTRA